MVKKWGNSLGVRIPNLIVRELSLKDGSLVDINDKGKTIIIKPIQKNKLSEMLNNGRFGLLTSFLPSNSKKTSN